MKALYQKIKDLNLGKVYAYVMETNPSNHLPYHNSFHMESVTNMAILGGIYYGLTDEEMGDLIRAGLFHDYNHSGSGKDDKINILRAIDAVVGYVYKTGDLTFNEIKVNKLIFATQYPYTQEASELTISQQILRDADILQGLFVQNYVNGVALAIAQEANIPYKNMLNGQEAFLTGTKFCTEWATNLANGKLPEVIEKVNIVKQFFNENSSNI